MASTARRVMMMAILLASVRTLAGDKGGNALDALRAFVETASIELAARAAEPPSFAQPFPFLPAVEATYSLDSGLSVSISAPIKERIQLIVGNRLTRRNEGLYLVERLEAHRSSVKDVVRLSVQLLQHSTEIEIIEHWIEASTGTVGEPADRQGDEASASTGVDIEYLRFGLRSATIGRARALRRLMTMSTRASDLVGTLFSPGTDISVPSELKRIGFPLDPNQLTPNMTERIARESGDAEVLLSQVSRFPSVTPAISMSWLPGELSFTVSARVAMAIGPLRVSSDVAKAVDSPDQPIRATFSITFDNQKPVVPYSAERLFASGGTDYLVTFEEDVELLTAQSRLSRIASQAAVDSLSENPSMQAVRFAAEHELQYLAAVALKHSLLLETLADFGYFDEARE